MGVTRLFSVERVVGCPVPVVLVPVLGVVLVDRGFRD
jgi:hypothetical protein